MRRRVSQADSGSIVVERDLWRHERLAWADGYEVVGGIDEAGRGPLAGPVVAACVVLPRGFSELDIDDSKKLTELRRTRAAARILAEALAVGVGVIGPAEIDQVNILRATHLAMRAAFLALQPPLPVDLVLVDGLPVTSLPCPHRAVVGGDALSASIAAASIIAKTERDRMMVELDSEYPEYGFASHKGYGAPAHLRALREHGACPHHRRSFAPVAAACNHLFTHAHESQSTHP